MTNRILGTLGVVFILLLPAAPARAQENSEVTGVVVDAQTGLPIEGVSIAIGGGNLGFTDSDGRYVVEVPPGEHLASFDITGYQRFETQVTVGAGESVQLDVAMEPAPSGDVTGVVTDNSTGEPLPGVLVHLFVGGTCETQSGPFLALAETDADGRFISETLATGSALVDVSQSGYKRHQTEIQVLDGITVDLNIALVPEGSDQPTTSCPEAPVTDVGESETPGDQEALPLTGASSVSLVVAAVLILLTGVALVVVSPHGKELA